jgi:hypothetical protein
MARTVARMLVVAACLWITAVSDADPLAVVAPCVTVSPQERQALARGETVGRALPAHHGQVALFAATRIAAGADTLAAATRGIADLKKSSFVSAIKRFSEPPQLSDLDELTPSERDITAMGQCAVGNCSLKLTAAEIAALQPHRGDRRALILAFRRAVLDRVTAYLSGGLAALPPIANRSQSKKLSDTLAALQAASPCVMQREPLAGWIRDYPAVGRDLESFVYWSHESYGSGKPVVVVTHVAIYREQPDAVIVVGKQILTTRYLDGGLSMTAITAGSDGTRYLTYLNRSSVDLLGGLFGGVKRAVLESRLSGEVPEIVAKLRTRLERSAYDSRPRSLRHD